MRSFVTGTVAALAVLLGGCAAPEPTAPRGDDRPETSSPADPGTSAPTPSEPAAEETGTAASPAVLEPQDGPLNWQDVDAPLSDTVTTSGPWTLTVPENGDSATLDGPRSFRFDVPPRHRITDALIDGGYAVVVSEDTLAQQGNIATVVDLASGDRFTVDQTSSVPTTTGGTWALGEGTLLHATIGPERSYCLAEVDLATRSSERGWCAPPRHGFNDARITPAGRTLLTFDDGRPSCRTVVEVHGADVVPFEDVAACDAWDAAVVPGGAVWSVVPNPNRIEAAHFYARSEGGWYDLGPGTSGSLTWCGGAAYFVQDPQRDGDPARLLSWVPGEPLTVAYQTEGRGPAFLSAPRCGGDALTFSVLAESGDVQLTTDLG